MNASTFRTAIFFVGAVLLLCVAGIIALSAGAGSGRPVPDILQNIASGSLAGLIGLLVQPQREDSTDAQDSTGPSLAMTRRRKRANPDDDGLDGR